jgi:hypothetical protein
MCAFDQPFNGDAPAPGVATPAGYALCADVRKMGLTSIMVI